ncbi:hypothetical protein KFE80_07855 [bacterium SCSIO 12696]|nr:hypothetical protein KFE80_07855 [bacterium SCSIO 12696]
MCIFELTAILEQYKIPHRLDNGKVMAKGRDNHWLDVTGWSRLQMAKWLQT